MLDSKGYPQLVDFMKMCPPLPRASRHRTAWWEVVRSMARSSWPSDLSVCGRGRRVSLNSCRTLIATARTTAITWRVQPAGAFQLLLYRNGTRGLLHDRYRFVRDRGPWAKCGMRRAKLGHRSGAQVAPSRAFFVCWWRALTFPKKRKRRKEEVLEGE